MPTCPVFAGPVTYLLHIINSTFNNISKTKLIISRIGGYGRRKPLVTLLLTNITFKQIDAPYLIDLAETIAIIQGPTYFTALNCVDNTGTVMKLYKDVVMFTNYVEFSFINSNIMLIADYFVLESHTVVNFTSNKFKIALGFPRNMKRFSYLLCAFQFVDSVFNLAKTSISYDYGIIFNNNSGSILINKRYSVSHCTWIERSAFLSADPQVINNQFIRYSNNSFNTTTINNQVCICADAQNYSCTTGEMQPTYPGQNYSIRLIAKNVSSSPVNIKIDEVPFTSCKLKTELKEIAVFQNSCITFHNIIQFKNRRSCELYLRGTMLVSTGIGKLNVLWYDDIIDVYHISMIPCPIGFVLNTAEGICQCDSLLKGSLVSITDCNINDQTILRPANSWISAHTVNNSYTYDVSLECPFDYCKPHQSYINLTTPNLQCQFNRYGVLCGHCPPGHSTVFGSSRCKHCSNVNLLIIIPIAITGIVLVFLLFLLNLTVTDGSITPFIYYVNIISINSAVFFPEHHSLFTKFTYAFVSITNLDLGIETCFYDGMTGYTKIFLQLVFPFYLISIAILLIVASRYSYRIQRLTARRALPVLATLFILSYTKILQTVWMALFFYSSVTHLPSKQTTTIWSVDTSVTIFEAKYIVLFIVCLILFVVLWMFNGLLLFIRPLSRFKFINHFKPLLDAYQGPYKDKFYYWSGLQLITRAVVFGVSALDRNIHLIIACMLLCIAAYLHGQFNPFKKKARNSQEGFFLINLQYIFLIRILTATNGVFVNILIAIAATQFAIILAKQVKTIIPQGKVSQLIDIICIKLKLLSEGRQIQIHNIELASIVPDRNIYHEFQEPMLQDF